MTRSVDGPAYTPGPPPEDLYLAEDAPCTKLWFAGGETYSGNAAGDCVVAAPLTFSDAAD